MCYSLSREELYSFGIKGLRTALRRAGFRLGDLEGSLGVGEAGPRLLYNMERKDREGGVIERVSWSVVVCRDREGLCLVILDPAGKRLGDIYHLVKRESNLKPGTYRYFIRDPYSPPGEDILCDRLYFLPGPGEFVSRAILRSHGVLYSQQRKGRISRYYFPSTQLPSIRYRKSHYRGRVTPFWERYQRVADDLDNRRLEYDIANEIIDFGLPPGLKEEIVESYCRHTGRKTKPKGVYYIPRRR